MTVPLGLVVITAAVMTGTGLGSIFRIPPVTGLGSLGAVPPVTGLVVITPGVMTRRGLSVGMAKVLTETFKQGLGTFSVLGSGHYGGRNDRDGAQYSGSTGLSIGLAAVPMEGAFCHGSVCLDRGNGQRAFPPLLE